MPVVSGGAVSADSVSGLPQNVVTAAASSKGILVQQEDLRLADGLVIKSSGPTTQDVKPQLTAARQTDWNLDAGATLQRLFLFPDNPPIRPSAAARQAEYVFDVGGVIVSRSSNYQFPPLSAKSLVVRQAEWNPDSGSVSTPRISLAGALSTFSVSPIMETEAPRFGGSVFISPIRGLNPPPVIVLAYRKTRSEIGTRAGSRQAGIE